MALELEVLPKEKRVQTSHPPSVSSLSNGYWGVMKKGTIELSA